MNDVEDDSWFPISMPLEPVKTECTHPWEGLTVTIRVAKPGGVFFQGVDVMCHRCGERLVVEKGHYALVGSDGMSYPELLAKLQQAEQTIDEHAAQCGDVPEVLIYRAETAEKRVAELEAMLKVKQ